jgi:glutaredoxin
MISKVDCSWCDKAKALLKQQGEDVVVYDYQEHPMIVKLMFEAALKTVPQVWYNGTHIGNYEDLVEWFEKT